MVLKKRFREAARNEFRFFFFSFVLFIVVVMILTTVATSLYPYFSRFVPSLASDCMKVQKLVLVVQKQILSMEKFAINNQIIFFSWIFLTACSIQLPFRHLFRVFWFELQKCLEKNFSLFCSVFLNFCPCFSFRSFANLRLAFSLKKLLDRQLKQ